MRKTLATLTFIAALALAGCGSVTQSADVAQTTTATTTSQTTTETTTSSDKEYKLIGKKAEGSSVFVLDLENKTGNDIISFQVKAESEKDYPANMLDEKDPFLKNEKRKLYYVPTKVSDIVYEDSDKVSSLQYSIKLVFADKKEVVLHNFPFGSLDSAEIFLEKNIGYIKYTSKLTNEKVDTKEAEEMTASLPETTTEAMSEVDPDANENIDAHYVEDATQAAVQQQAPVQQQSPANEPATGCGDRFASNPVKEEPATGCGDRFASNPVNEEPATGCGDRFASNPVNEEPATGCGDRFASNY